MNETSRAIVKSLSRPSRVSPPRPPVPGNGDPEPANDSEPE